MKISNRTIMVWLAVAAVYFAAGEAFRAYARAGLEREMRADFEKLLCPADRIDGDICLDFPDEGRCVSGKYVDYRTVWGRVWFDAGATRVVAHHHERLGHDKRKLANWLACQGFRAVVPTDDRGNHPTGYRVSGPLFVDDGSGIAARMFFRAGFGPVSITMLPFPFRFLVAGYGGGIAIHLEEENAVLVRISNRGPWAK